MVLLLEGSTCNAANKGHLLEGSTCSAANKAHLLEGSTCGAANNTWLTTMTKKHYQDVLHYSQQQGPPALAGAQACSCEKAHKNRNTPEDLYLI